MDEVLLDRAKRSPGSLTHATLLKMREYLTTLQGGGQKADELEPVAMAYLTSVLMPTRGSQMSLRNTGELKTLAKTIDMLMKGEVAQAADVLSQRFQAVETADAEGSWSTARHLELIPEARVSSVPQTDRRRAVRLENAEQKLKKSTDLARAPRQGTQAPKPAGHDGRG